MQIKFCSKKTFYLQPIPELWLKGREIIQQAFKQTYKRVIRLNFLVLVIVTATFQNKKLN